MVEATGGRNPREIDAESLEIRRTVEDTGAGGGCMRNAVVFG